MKEMKKFPSIEQFRNVIREVKHKAAFVGVDDNGDPIYNPNAVLPTLKFRGGVKMHGTNAGIVYTWDPLSFTYDFHVQSRSNIITPLKDNAGFATFVHGVNTDDLLGKVMTAVGQLEATPSEIAIFGEWCGGNIQAGVALNGLNKMFVIFAIKIDDVWLSDDKLSQVKLPDAKIYNILDYQTYEVTIDFNQAERSLNEIIDLTLAVENECPVAKEFGNSGIGEGIVFHCIEEGYSSSRFWFKSKGEKHAGSSKVKTNVRVDVERLDNIKELVETLVTNRRLEQGLEYLAEQGLGIERKNIGTYIKWVIGDVVKEELDTITENGFEVKEVANPISTKARTFFFDKENSGVNL